MLFVLVDGYQSQRIYLLEWLEFLEVLIPLMMVTGV